MPAELSCSSNIIHEDVISRVRELMPEDEEFIELADLYKMFSDSTRVRILWALQQSEMCVCDLSCLLGSTVSAVSHQLRLLKAARLVKSRKDGKVVYYSLSDDHIHAIFAQGFEHINE